MTKIKLKQSNLLFTSLLPNNKQQEVLSQTTLPLPSLPPLTISTTTTATTTTKHYEKRLTVNQCINGIYDVKRD